MDLIHFNQMRPKTELFLHLDLNIVDSEARVGGKVLK